MSFVLKNSLNYTGAEVRSGDFLVGDDAEIRDISLCAENRYGDISIYNCLILPGFCDVHVHFREPGYLYKEDIYSGSCSAAAGGFTDVFTMPNLDPVPDSVQNLKVQLNAISEKAITGVHPYGAITVGEKGEKLSDMEGMSPFVIAFSDDGRGVQSRLMMEQAMKEAKRLGKIIAAHCEDNSLLNGGYIHDGKYAAANAHRGICSESEWKQIERDIELAAKTGCRYHVCHISAKESVELIRSAKMSGVDVTCETAPHYLLLDDSCLKDDGRFKMNPPLRDSSDREALIEGIIDGTVDMIATDHAPHSQEEKSRGLKGSLMGVVGLETAFPVLYTGLVKKGIISLDKLIRLMCENPRKRFGLEHNPGFSIWSVDESYRVVPEKFLTKGRSTPFDGMEVCGKCIATYCGGREIYHSNQKYR